MTAAQVEIFAQREQLRRVRTGIAAAIIAFCRQRVASAPEFHADELRQAVVEATGVSAPGSADRILRDLRQQHLVEYHVVHRRQSLYRVTSVA